MMGPSFGGTFFDRGVLRETLELGVIKEELFVGPIVLISTHPVLVYNLIRTDLPLAKTKDKQNCKAMSSPI